MLGMSEYQLDLMFEYIELTKGISTHSSAVRIAEIRKTLLEDARENEIRLGDISRKIDKMKLHTTVFK
jgi:hypothetical protein